MDTFIGFFLFASVIWLMVNWWFHRVINKQKNALVGQLQGERFWRILIATPPFFERAMHVYSAEGGGVLIDEADSVLIKGLLRAREGEPIEQRFTK